MRWRRANPVPAAECGAGAVVLVTLPGRFHLRARPQNDNGPQRQCARWFPDQPAGGEHQPPAVRSLLIPNGLRPTPPLRGDAEGLTSRQGGGSGFSNRRGKEPTRRKLPALFVSDHAPELPQERCSNAALAGRASWARLAPPARKVVPVG